MLQTHDQPDAHNLVDDVIHRWRGGEAPDTAGFLASHPQVADHKSLVLDLIHEEYCLRKETGETFVPSTFIERFPQYQRSIAKMLAVEHYGEQHPGFAVALAEGQWPQVGSTYLGFEIVEPLGRGALARVYLARELDMGRRPVVIKVAPHGGHEAHLLGKLAHGNIVSAHSVRQDEATGMTVICMPLLGTSTALDLLDKAFADKRLPETAEPIRRAAGRYQPAGLVKEESLAPAIPFGQRTYVEGIAWMMAELARGLAAAHALGVVHRDIKPSNILLAWSGRPMLLDFNLSTDLDQQADRLGGTLAYMAPERIYTLLIGQAVQESAVDPRSDVFSLGALAYELLTGRLPVLPENAEQTDEAAQRRWLAARSQPMARPSTYNRQVDAAVDRIVLKCLAPEPQQRFASAVELAQAWEAYLGPRANTVRWLRRNRRRLVVGGLAALGASALAGTLWWRLPPAGVRHYQQGLQLYNQGEYSLAVRAFDRSLASQSESVPALFGRAQSYFRLGNMTSAQRDYVAAATIDDRALFWFCAACCRLKSSDGSASEQLGKALKLGYDKAEVYLNLGKLNYYNGQHSRAIASFTKAIEQNDQLAEAYYFRAMIRLNQFSGPQEPLLPNAIADVEAAIRLGPPSRSLSWLAARVFALAGADYRERAEDFVRLLIRQGESRQNVESHPKLEPILNALPDADQLHADAEPALGEFPTQSGPPDSADLQLAVGH